VEVWGFEAMPANSLITITMRVFIPYNSSNPYFTINVNIGGRDSVALNPVMKNSVTSTQTVIPGTFISSLTGSEGELNKLTKMQSSDSSISFIVTVNSPTGVGSSVQIIVSNSIQKSPFFSNSTSCLLNGVNQLCNIITNQIYTTISISSNNSSNIFPQFTPISVRINNLVILECSSYSYRVYHLYFLFTSSSLPSNVTNSTIIVPIVIP
jgi:hypothetical protein